MREREKEKVGPLAGHERHRRRYLPPLAATGVLEIQDWVRDDLPDLIWPALYLAHADSTAAARSVVSWQIQVQDDLAGQAEPSVLANGVDGRLSSLDRLAEACPSARAVARSRAEELGLLPPLVAGVLTSFPNRPAEWLVDGELHPPDRDEIDLLAKALVEAISDGHREAVLKCLWIWSSVNAGTFSTTKDVIDLLQPYPNDADTRSQADSVIRASWGSRQLVVAHEDGTYFDDAFEWAKVFWRVNSLTTRCLRRREVEDSSAKASEDDAPDDETSGEDDARNGDHLQQLAMDLLASYIEALERSPSDLYFHERHEVHAGLVCRAGREVITALGNRDLWCIEHGSHVARVLLEVRIYLKWMSLQDVDIYRRYQEFGAGKAKLYARIMDEVSEVVEIPGAKEALDELVRLSHNDGVLDTRVVDTADSFSGVSLRAMADECGLLDLYRHSYYLASGVAHSEWWSVETHAMERCLNVLHRGHLIPSMSLSAGAVVALAQSWIDQLYALMYESFSILGTSAEVVDEAFDWLKADQPPDATK